MLHQKTIELVRERAQIIDQFENTKLKKVGHEFAARCPWHDDKRPSLSISPQKNFAYCHVCARGVDTVGWIQDQEGLSFTDAVIKLADRYNIPVEHADSKDSEKFAREKAERDHLYAERAKTQQQFADAIWDSPGLEYLLGRELSYETIESWGLGWNGNRVMFPLCDQQGRTVGFTGRVLDDSKPKYKNSQNDAIYQKANLVFGLDRAHKTIIESSQVIVTEGQFDVIRLHQEGHQNVIAVSGSSLTKGMIERLIKTSRATQIVLCFDGDLGGEKAAERAINELQEFALRGELDLRILVMPEGTDPADCAEMFGFLLEEAVSWVEYMFEKAVAKIDLADPAAIATAERGVKKILRILPKGGLREYVQRRSKEVLKAIPDVAPAKVQTQKEIDKCAWAERRALRLYFHSPRDDHRDALGMIEYKNPRLAKIWGLVKIMTDMGVPFATLSRCLVKVLMADEVLIDELRPILRPIPEVKRVITSNPQGELEAAWDVLMSDCCQGSD